MHLNHYENPYSRLAQHMNCADANLALPGSVQAMPMTSDQYTLLAIIINRFLSCHLPHLPRHLALFASLLRIVFLPLFLFCNLAPRWFLSLLSLKFDIDIAFPCATWLQGLSSHLLHILQNLISCYRPLLQIGFKVFLFSTSRSI